MKTIFRSTIILGVFVILLCGIYPLLVWAVGNLLFPDKAQGSLIEKEGKLVGSNLIGQIFTKPQYFQTRPSAAGNGYDASNSSGSNLGSTSKKLIDRMKVDIERVKKENPTLKDGEIPPELVTASASGLDPHITPRAAQVQMKRVATARKVSEADIKKMVVQFTEGPQLGIFGNERVNVLMLNLELDKVYPVGH